MNELGFEVEREADGDGAAVSNAGLWPGERWPEEAEELRTTAIVAQSPASPSAKKKARVEGWGPTFVQPLELEVIYKARWLAPDSVKKALQSTSARRFCGVLPEIDCLWVSSDTQLLLWNYAENAGGNGTWSINLPGLVLSVGLTATKPTVVKKQTIGDAQHVPYMLAVATTEGVSLYLVCKIRPTNLYKLTEAKGFPFTTPRNNPMLHVRGSAAGHIFCVSADGHLHSLHYDVKTERYWRVLQPSRSVNTHSIVRHAPRSDAGAGAGGGAGGGVKGLLGLGLGLLLGSAAAAADESEGVAPSLAHGEAVDLVVDDSRCLVYVLYASGVLGVLSFGAGFSLTTETDSSSATSSLLPLPPPPPAPTQSTRRAEYRLLDLYDVLHSKFPGFLPVFDASTSAASRDPLPLRVVPLSHCERLAGNRSGAGPVDAFIVLDNGARVGIEYRGEPDGKILVQRLLHPPAGQSGGQRVSHAAHACGELLLATGLGCTQVLAAASGGAVGEVLRGEMDGSEVLDIQASCVAKDDVSRRLLAAAMNTPAPHLPCFLPQSDERSEWRPERSQAEEAAARAREAGSRRELPRALSAQALRQAPLGPAQEFVIACRDGVQIIQLEVPPAARTGSSVVVSRAGTGPGRVVLRAPGDWADDGAGGLRTEEGSMVIGDLCHELEDDDKRLELIRSLSKDLATAQARGGGLGLGGGLSRSSTASTAASPRSTQSFGGYGVSARPQSLRFCFEFGPLSGEDLYRGAARHLARVLLPLWRTPFTVAQPERVFSPCYRDHAHACEPVISALRSFCEFVPQLDFGLGRALLDVDRSNLSSLVLVAQRALKALRLIKVTTFITYGAAEPVQEQLQGDEGGGEGEGEDVEMDEGHAAAAAAAAAVAGAAAAAASAEEHPLVMLDNLTLCQAVEAPYRFKRFLHAAARAINRQTAEYTQTDSPVDADMDEDDGGGDDGLGAKRFARKLYEAAWPAAEAQRPPSRETEEGRRAAMSSFWLQYDVDEVGGDFKMAELLQLDAEDLREAKQHILAAVGGWSYEARGGRGIVLCNPNMTLRQLYAELSQVLSSSPQLAEGIYKAQIDVAAEVCRVHFPDPVPEQEAIVDAVVACLLDCLPQQQEQRPLLERLMAYALEENLPGLPVLGLGLRRPLPLKAICNYFLVPGRDTSVLNSGPLLSYGTLEYLRDGCLVAAHGDVHKQNALVVIVYNVYKHLALREQRVEVLANCIEFLEDYTLPLSDDGQGPMPHPLSEDHVTRMMLMAEAADQHLHLVVNRCPAGQREQQLRQGSVETLRRWRDYLLCKVQRQLSVHLAGAGAGGAGARRLLPRVSGHVLSFDEWFRPTLGSGGVPPSVAEELKSCGAPDALLYLLRAVEISEAAVLPKRAHIEAVPELPLPRNSLPGHSGFSGDDRLALWAAAIDRPDPRGAEDALCDVLALQCWQLEHGFGPAAAASSVGLYFLQALQHQQAAEAAAAGAADEPFVEPPMDVLHRLGFRRVGVVVAAMGILTSMKTAGKQRNPLGLAKMPTQAQTDALVLALATLLHTWLVREAESRDVRPLSEHRALEEFVKALSSSDSLFSSQAVALEFRALLNDIEQRSRTIHQ